MRLGPLLRRDLARSRRRLVTVGLAVAGSVAVITLLSAVALGLYRGVIEPLLPRLPLDLLKVEPKTVSVGLLALDAGEVAEQEPNPCIRCGSCVKACPMGLLPLEMSARIRSEAFDEAIDLGLKDCIACGCCAYVCPSRIPLVQYFVHAKGELASQDRAKLRTEATKKLAQQRQERLDREAREKAEAAAKRKAEREAAAAKAAAPASAETQGASA